MRSSCSRFSRRRAPSPSLPHRAELTRLLHNRLKNLKRRGFNVDRIMNARKAEREAADQRMREERLQAQLKAQSALVSLIRCY